MSFSDDRGGEDALSCRGGEGGPSCSISGEEALSCSSKWVRLKLLDGGAESRPPPIRRRLLPRGPLLFSDALLSASPQGPLLRNDALLLASGMTGSTGTSLTSLLSRKEVSPS